VSIINESKTTNDINLAVKNLLKNKISIFENAHFAEYYQLDAVRVALAQFKNYFSHCNSAIGNNSSTVESEETLKFKSSYINDFIKIAENDQIAIKNRLKQIKSIVKFNPNFERIILAQKQVDYFSFAYLKQCFFSLLEALHLYTPERKKQLNNLKNAVDHQPKINELTNRFGLFAATTAAPDAPIKLETSPSLTA
jgi:hypothetical protein